MSIGTNIKRLRRERNITQEQLSEQLGLTPSAISQWETDRVLPDVVQIPLLAGIFRVSADVILGIALDGSGGKISAVLEEADSLTRSGKFSAAARLLGGAHRSFPNAFSIMVKLADALLNSWIRGQGEGKPEEIQGLCEKVLEDCTDQALRNEAISLLGSVYRYTGQTDALLRMAESLPHAWESREDLLMWNFSGEESRLNDMDYVQFCLGRLGVCLNKLEESKNQQGEYCYSPADRIRLNEQVIALFQTIYCDGDYFYYAQDLENACRNLAGIALQEGDAAGAMHWMEEAGRYAVHFDTYVENTPHTSPAVRGYTVGGWIMEEAGNRSAQMLDDLEKEPRWAALRGEGAYPHLLAMLKQYAKKP